ncbi:hypothetical protein C2869_18190 [Saccharobesus litoralis]|uniref:Uncharacterized protein n=1 Tax=Saccharobesus litoralis TaxID=2172099 RepID=A0A2S0VVL9_9ALTE|nr:hypothetical protein [Saccharobesus litoralis]AWB68223.1 hypothetical protein C2869_18190 [Saccharobesus litoralis]
MFRPVLLLSCFTLSACQLLPQAQQPAPVNAVAQSEIQKPVPKIIQAKNATVQVSPIGAKQQFSEQVAVVNKPRWLAGASPKPAEIASLATTQSSAKPHKSENEAEKQPEIETSITTDGTDVKPNPHVMQAAVLDADYSLGDLVCRDNVDVDYQIKNKRYYSSVQLHAVVESVSQDKQTLGLKLKSWHSADTTFTGRLADLKQAPSAVNLQLQVGNQFWQPSIYWQACQL